jgi:hypothetical protein
MPTIPFRQLAPGDVVKNIPIGRGRVNFNVSQQLSRHVWELSPLNSSVAGLYFTLSGNSSINEPVEVNRIPNGFTRKILSDVGPGDVVLFDGRRHVVSNKRTNSNRVTLYELYNNNNINARGTPFYNAFSNSYVLARHRVLSLSNLRSMNTLNTSNLRASEHLNSFITPSSVFGFPQSRRSSSFHTLPSNRR